MSCPTPSSIQRLHVAIRGAVQGVGFRPFIFRLARELELNGWVNNSPQGVFIEAEGGQEQLETFLVRIPREKPGPAFIQSLEPRWLGPVGYTGFEIRASDTAGAKTAILLPDIATCPDCLREILDPANRRYQYPFTNCTLCGPRFSIVHRLPYDRESTSMWIFKMCPQCRAEYENPRDRRFHAQPNACPVCGPHLQLWDPSGNVLAEREEALTATAEGLRAGKVIAFKGIGGFQLMVAAVKDASVLHLRAAKHREAKPFALMFPSIAAVKEICEVSPLEERLLNSPEAPITLLRRKMDGAEEMISRHVAPGNPYLGIMLPYSPLHHLLMRNFGAPVVATSGNAADEPICTDETEALRRLAGIPDLLLVHNRPIVRHVDDSIVRVMAGREMVLRRARGYAPLPVRIGCGAGTPGGESPFSAELRNQAPTVLAVGAHLKNTVALSPGSDVFISQHIGDLETAIAFGAFQQVIQNFEQMYECTPAVVVADLHPEYLSTKHAAGLPARLLQVQHHLAHVFSCMAENDVTPPVLGVSWDGTGYGLDGTIWGGEFFVVTDDSWRRAAHMRAFSLPGGSKAIQEPRRSATGALYELFGEETLELISSLLPDVFSPGELNGLHHMLVRNLNCPRTTSAGRLFDVVASLAGLVQVSRFEGDAAMRLEFALDGIQTQEAYPCRFIAATGRPANAGSLENPKVKPELVIDWAPILRGIIEDRKAGVSPGIISARFHNWLVRVVVETAQRLGMGRVVLSGGCFQNKYLTENCVSALRREGLQPYWHQRVPPNDGGISLGQVVAARSGRI